MIYRMAPYSATLNDPYSRFQGHTIIWCWQFQKRYEMHSFNEILIGTCTRRTQQCHFEWPWVTLRNIQWHEASRGLSATAELLVGAMTTGRTIDGRTEAHSQRISGRYDGPTIIDYLAAGRSHSDSASSLCRVIGDIDCTSTEWHERREVFIQRMTNRLISMSPQTSCMFCQNTFVCILCIHKFILYIWYTMVRTYLYYFLNYRVRPNCMAVRLWRASSLCSGDIDDTTELQCNRSVTVTCVTWRDVASNNVESSMCEHSRLGIFPPKINPVLVGGSGVRVSPIVLNLLYGVISWWRIFKQYLTHGEFKWLPNRRIRWICFDDIK